MDKPDTQDAHVYALADVANVKLTLRDLDGAQKDLENCQRVLDSFDSVETIVHASFYKVNAGYYNVRCAPLANNLKKETEKRANRRIPTGQARIRLVLQKHPSVSCLQGPGGNSRIGARGARLQPQRGGVSV